MKTPSKLFSIGDQITGPDHPPIVIAELSANHNGSLETALKTIEMAKKAGADAVKLQTYTPDTLTIDHDGPDFTISGGLWDGYSLYQLYKEAQTPWDWHPALFEKGRELGITVFSTPFDETAVDFLEELDCPIYKVASFEAADLELVKKIAATGKPVIVSTGMLSPEEIDELVECALKFGSGELALLHCVSAYPASIEGTNLATIPHMATRHGTVIGLSDHTLGTVVSVAAVARGATIIEKHVTLSRSDGGVDSAFSLEPEELAKLVEDCRSSWLAMGNIHEGRQEEASENVVFRRSLYAVKDIKKDDLLTSENIRSIRPGYGLPPKHIKQVIGQWATSDISRGTPVTWELVKEKN